MSRSIAVAVFSILLVLTGCKKQETVTVQIPVGMAISLTGNFGPYGINQKNGLELALDELNENADLHGFELIPHFFDDQSSPDTCRKIFREMILNHQVMAIIGPTSSNSAFMADTVAQNNKVSVIGISNTVPGITEMGNYVFRNSLMESSVIPNTVKATHVKLGYSRVAIVYGNDDPYTIGAYDAFKAALENTPGVTIVSTEVIHKGDKEFTAQVTRIKESNPDAIVLAALVAEASLLMVKARELGIPASVRFIGGNSFNTSQLWQLAGEASQKAICGSAWIYSENTPGNSQFVTSYTARFGSKPDQFAAQAYASLYILADAIKRAGKVNNLTLRDALANTQNLQTILGSFSFDANRNPVHTPVVQELVNGQFFIFQ